MKSVVKSVWYILDFRYIHVAARVVYIYALKFVELDSRQHAYARASCEACSRVESIEFHLEAALK